MCKPTRRWCTPTYQGLIHTPGMVNHSSHTLTSPPLMWEPPCRWYALLPWVHSHPEGWSATPGTSSPLRSLRVDVRADGALALLYPALMHTLIVVHSVYTLVSLPLVCKPPCGGRAPPLWVDSTTPGVAHHPGHVFASPPLVCKPSCGWCVPPLWTYSHPERGPPLRACAHLSTSCV